MDCIRNKPSAWKHSWKLSSLLDIYSQMEPLLQQIKDLAYPCPKVTLVSFLSLYLLESTSSLQSALASTHESPQRAQNTNLETIIQNSHGCWGTNFQVGHYFRHGNSPALLPTVWPQETRVWGVTAFSSQSLVLQFLFLHSDTARMVATEWVVFPQACCKFPRLSLTTWSFVPEEVMWLMVYCSGYHYFGHPRT